MVVDGQTVHTALNLDLQTGFFSKSDFKRIPAHKLDLMKDAVFNSVLYIIIDEVSMMGIDVLKHVNQRLHELKSLPSLSNQAFGGIHVIFCGDFYQLPPVMSRTVFSNTCSSLSQTVDLWKDHVTFTELTEVVRSKGDADFTQLCHRVRVGIITDADMATLNARVIPAPSDSEILDDMKICYTNQECFNHNEKCIQLMRQSTTIHTFNSIDSFKSDQLNSTECLAKLMPNDPSKTAGLPKKLEICIGARIMIRVNVDTLDRIVNGVMGTVRFIDFSAKSKLPHVYVEFDDKSAGVKTGLKHEKCNFFCKKTLPCPKLGFVKIVPQEKDFISSVNKRTWVRRYQLPMVLSWATTVHKVQGLTVTNACVALHGHKPGVKWPPGAAYVALSRFQRLSDVRLSAFDRHQIRTCPMVAGEYDRLRKLPKFVNPYTNVHPLPKSLSQQLSPNNNDNLHGDNHSNPNDNNLSPTCESSTPLPTDSIFGSPGIEILSQPIQSPIKPFLSPEYSNTLPGPSNLPGLPPQQSDFPCIGRARVIDFWNHPNAQQVADRLRNSGFEVDALIEFGQTGITCGFNAAMIAAKLAHYEGCWFDVDVRDCCYGSPENEASLSKSRMVTMANEFLFNQDIAEGRFDNLERDPNQGRFLSDTECSYLVDFYNLTLYANRALDRTRIVSFPVHKEAFFSQILDSAISRAKYSRLFVSIVNTHGGVGVHWFVVAFELYDNIPHLMTLMNTPHEA